MPVAAFILIGMAIGFLILALANFKPTRAVMAGLMAQVGVWMSYTAVRLLPEMAVFFARQLLRGFHASSPAMTALFASLLTEITGEDIPPSEIEGRRSSASILATGESFATHLVPDFLAALMPTAPVTPAAARAASERLLGIGLAFNLHSWSAHTVLELLSLGQLSWAAEVTEAIASGLGLPRVTRRLVQTLYGTAIAPKLEADLNETYRPTGLTTGEAVDAWQQGLLDDGAVLQSLARKGYSYETALLLLNVRQRDFSRSEVEQLWRLGLVDEAFVGRWTRRQGYGAARAELMEALIRSERSQAVLGQIAAAGRKLYRLGQVDAGELREILRQAGYRDAEVDLILVQEDLAGREERLLTKAEVLAAYREGALDAAEARDRLRLLRYPDPDIDVFLATQVKQLSVPQVVDALVRGIIPEVRGRELLAQQGYREADIDVLLDLRVRRLSPGQVIDAVRTGLLQPAAARRLLEQAGFEAETIDLLLAFERRQLSVADVTAALVRGLVTETEARARLLGLGYAPEDADLLLQLRFQRISSGEVLDAYAAGLVTRTEARQRLQQVGFARDDAELLLQVFEIRQVPRARLAVGQLLEALRHGILDEGAVRGRLAALGYSRADQDILIDLVAVRQPAPDEGGG